MARSAWLWAALWLAAGAGARRPNGPAPIRPAPRGKERHDAANCYIVQLQPNASRGREDDLFGRVRGDGQGRAWGAAFRGFCRCGLSSDVLDALADEDDVQMIFEDQILNVTATTQQSVTWGLDRIDQRSLPLSGTYTYSYDGAGVNVFVVDSGIDSTQTEFTGRIVAGINYVPNSQTTTDCLGHGTHVSGIAVGTTYGVAKKANVVPVRAVDCTGSGATSNVISGIDWAVKQHQTLGRPSVINLSLGGDYDLALNQAVTGAVNNGVPVVVSAGNSAVDACGISPASTAAAITVGASTYQDAQASFSNWGSCVDIFAPGQSITSAYPYALAPSGSATLSGTSMSAPFVTGAVALYLGVNPTATPAQVAAWLYATATTGALNSLSVNTTNRLLYVPNDIPPLPRPVPTPSPLPVPIPDPSPSPLPTPILKPSPSPSPANAVPPTTVCLTFQSTAGAPPRRIGWTISKGAVVVATVAPQGGTQSVTHCLQPGPYILTTLTVGSLAGSIQIHQGFRFLYVISQVSNNQRYSFTAPDATSVNALPDTPPKGAEGPQELAEAAPADDGADTTPEAGAGSGGADDSNGALYGLWALLLILPLVGALACWWAGRSPAAGVNASTTPTVPGKLVASRLPEASSYIQVEIDNHSTPSDCGAAGGPEGRPAPGPSPER